MERWVGKVAVVTGASSGIGAAITKELVKAGLTVIGLARRQDRVEALLGEIPESQRKGKLHAIKLDITNDDEVNAVFAKIESQFGAVHILVNNAGVSRTTSITDNGNEEDLKLVLKTNLWGVVLATKRVVSIMKKHNVISGHIVNINSLMGHKVLGGTPGVKPNINLYAPSKYGVTALTEVLRQEFNFDKLKTKITSISPGLVKTEIIDGPELSAEAKAYIRSLPVLDAEDIANAVLYVLGTPPSVQVHELIIKPNGEPF